MTWRPSKAAVEVALDAFYPNLNERQARSGMDGWNRLMRRALIAAWKVDYGSPRPRRRKQG